MKFTARYERIVISDDPVKVVFSSEPYVVLTATGFSVAADVLECRGKLRFEKSILLGAKSLSIEIFARIADNNGSLVGVSVLIRKESPERTSKYIVED